ncbi:hypothetical protein CVT24_007920 [Panaeolus cyanescens]|uniref:Uncharacterized protein n=1 Tax=Panaeolus cyanescens TaxID=181874 RepID=A0A409W0C7_9AGAR|nr:hypothetical protein CVT24_007920 [Panaeolus cyanescens]
MQANRRQNHRRHRGNRNGANASRDDTGQSIFFGCSKMVIKGQNVNMTTNGKVNNFTVVNQKTSVEGSRSETTTTTPEPAAATNPETATATTAPA